MYRLTMGSLFDGIGGWCLAAVRAGIRPIWSSEIERFPLEVTKRRFPYVCQLGDITKLDGATLEPVDIICAGSPCQDLSIAGNRKGLEGERSGLLLRAINIVRSMRDATDGQFPRFFVWENVPGAFSSNRGADFRAVLEEIAETKIPMPNGGKWANAGVVECEQRQVAWRVLDAQYWGVPQRRKRIFLVADFRGRSASEILFEPEGVPGNTAQNRGERKGVAGRLKGSAGEASGACVTAYCIQGNVVDSNSAQNGIGISEDKAYTLNATDRPAVYGFNTMVSGADSNPVLREKAPSMRTTTRLGVMLFDNHAQDSRITGPLETACSVSAKYGTGGGNTPLIQYFCIGNGQVNQIGLSDKVGTLTCVHDPQAVMAVDCRHGNENNIAGTLQAKGQGGYSLNYQPAVREDKTIRRLTPLECERLQGLPDNWTLIHDRSCSDSARYKAIGNGMAQPCADWIMTRIAEVEND